MTISVKTTCPLGSECEKVVDGEIHRCAWYVTLEGTNPQNGKQVNDSKCAIAWQPILLIENSLQVKTVSASIQSMRNVTVENQNKALRELKNHGRISSAE